MIKEIIKNRFFILFILISILFSLRLSLLLTTFNKIWCEEGAHGIAAKHILEGNFSQSISDYFHPHEGGSVVVSFLAVPFFWLFGISTISLRLVPLLFSIAILASLFLFLERYFGRKVAALASLLYIFPPLSYSQYSAYCLGNHHVILLFDILMVSIFFRIFFAPGQYYKSKKYGYFMLLGLVSGFAGYICFSSFIFLLGILLFWYIFDRLFFLRREFFFFVILFALGISPLIYYIVSHYGYKNPFVSLFAEPIYFKELILKRLSLVIISFTQELMKSFNFDYYGAYPKRQLWNVFYYFVVLTSFTYLVWLNKNSLSKISKGIFSLKRSDIDPSQIKPESFFVVLLVVFVASSFPTFYCNFLLPARYFFPLYLFFYIFISLFIIKSLKNNMLVNLLLIPLLAIVLLIGVVSNAGLIGKKDAWCDNTYEQIRFLLAHNIKYVYTSYEHKWPLVFESKEQVITSAEDIWFLSHKEKAIFNSNSGLRYIEHEKAVERAVDSGVPYAYVFSPHAEFGHADMLEDYLKSNKINYEKTYIETDGYLILYNFSKAVKPRDIGFAERWKQKNQE